VTAVADVLEGARRHIAGGWAEPLSLDSAGHICRHDDEGLARFCVFDALEVAARGDVDAWMAADAVLEEQLRARGVRDGAVWAWLETPGRKQDEVVQLLGRAAARARAR
jgi:hypothetical protein